MTVEEFESALRCGLGRCVIHLKTCKNRKVYRAAVLDCCLNNPCFDTQCEGTRAAYIYDLVSAFDDTDYFLQPVLKKLKSSLDDCGWDFAHLCDLTAEFARRGDESALAVLEDIYAELYAVLLKRRDYEGYDGERDNFERLCVVFSDLYGLPAFIKTAGDIGELFSANDNYDGNDFDWFYIRFSDMVGKSELKKLMREESEKSPSVRAFYDEIIKAVAPLSDSSTLRERSKPNGNELLELAEKAVAENDPDKKAELLGVFRRCAFPLDHRYLIEYSQSRNGALREAAFDALEKCKSAEVRAYALQLIADKREPAYAINLLIANFLPSDGQLISDCLNSLEIDPDGESGWHGTVISILDAFDDGVKLPRGALTFIYEKSLCSCCREGAVRALSKRGWLTSEMKNECLYDSNADIRGFAKKFFD